MQNLRNAWNTKILIDFNFRIGNVRAIDKTS